MAFCTQCGKPVDDNTKFCPFCGAPVAAESAQAPQGGYQPPQGNYQAPQGNYQPYAQSPQDDVSTNKGYAILSYFSLLVLVPIFAAKNSKFARFHANQGLVLLIAEALYGIATAVIVAIFTLINWLVASIFSTILGLGSILFLVLAILGIVSAAQGECKPLPVLGKITILK